LAIDTMLTSETTWKRHQQHTQMSSNSSTIAADNNTGMYIIYYSIEDIPFSAEIHYQQQM
jgi:hypothetical protein